MPTLSELIEAKKQLGKTIEAALDKFEQEYPNTRIDEIAIYRLDSTQQGMSGTKSIITSVEVRTVIL